ncbi:mannitol dehydrogenase family protein [Isoptericola sp. NEAU-Y5]|uniref:Mannitol-1-phosphate 5-dehydrogenase n=1 Tax=Isoptericola luteus TaxID=2879484 RepID=A0ABS7ZB28_9MICO|nr:mannitol dehydrogenase family protein [Isoptericola sp. NEAU-Y5]MCA5892247.1 mannitol dehydrogenase family protein [Isoptericola sp. NEAU-Y5]
MTTDRLHRSAVPSGLVAPVAPDQVGIVHLGIGAFHRAHQAVFTELAARETGDLRWGILGVTQRSASVRDQLRPQGGVYSVLTAGTDGTTLDLVGSVVDVAWPAEETPRVLAALAAPTTHVVTLTVTEKGYARDADGRLDVARVSGDLAALRAEHVVDVDVDGDPGPGADTHHLLGGEPAHARPGESAVGLLVRGLAARQRASAAAGQARPVTVLTCDNMVDNGRVLQRLVSEAVDAALPGEAGDDLRAWLAAEVTFPCSMVDRIVPATTPDQRDQVARELGARDEGLVVGEPFRQWVIEDDFAGPRPAWELAGATFTTDVAPWERAKLRLLNGTHSLLAYAGRLAGHTTLAEAVTDPVLARRARAFMLDDALPTLEAPQGADLGAYATSLLERFANPATGHTTVQVSMDGTQKIPIRWGGTIADRLAAGVVPRQAAFALAAWSEVVRREAAAGREVDDPRAAELRHVVLDAGGGDAAAAGAADVARALVGLPGLLPPDVAGDAGLVAAVVAEVEALAAVPTAV